MKQVVVHKGRTNIISLSLGFDISDDEFASEIRAGKNRESTLIATWIPSFATDGVDGELILTLDDSVTQQITQSVGYMDVKHIKGTEPFPVFDDIIEVVFRETITE